MDFLGILATTTQSVAGEHSTAQVFRKRYFVAQSHNQ
jgi:hypothetical protein